VEREKFAFSIAELTDALALEVLTQRDPAAGCCGASMARFAQPLRGCCFCLPD
jgi:hypothetical protein